MIVSTESFIQKSTHHALRHSRRLVYVSCPCPSSYYSYVRGAFQQPEDKENTYGFRISTITFGVGEGTFTAGAPLVDATFPDRETTDGEKLRSFWSRLGVSICRF